MTLTDGVPVLDDTVALAVMSGVSPLSPFAPLIFSKAKSKLGVCMSPLLVTVTFGVPMLSSTLAVALITGVVPTVPSSPFSPFSPRSPFIF